VTEIRVSKVLKQGWKGVVYRHCFDAQRLNYIYLFLFGMFGGTEENVRLECKNNLVGVIIDRFGKDAMIIPSDGEHFRINVDVEVSQQFLAWVIGLGEGVKELSPEHVVEMMRTEAKRPMEQYK
jgi:predicted DNA-binding transcriptional regulator YafY